MTRCYRVNPDLFYPLAQVYVSLCAGDLLSFIARDSGSGELAGFIFCSDLSTDWTSRDPGMARMYSLFPGIASVLGSLEQRYGEQYPSGPGESFHIFQVGTSPRFQARGVAKALVSTAVKHARTRGFSYALTECTSPVSRGLFTSCEFLVAYEQPFRNFSGDLSCCFADLPGSITLMVRKL